MIYRKTPRQPGRLLLRVVAGAGATAVAGAMACSSGGDRVVCNGFCFDAGDAGHDAAVADASAGGYDGFTGSIVNPDSGACEEGCGLVGNPDAAADVLNGIVPPPDGGLE